MERLIEEAYEKTNYGGPDKIMKYLNTEHRNSNITRADVKRYLDEQVQEQLLKQTLPRKGLGHIVASYPGELYK